MPQGRLSVRHRLGTTADSVDSAGAIFHAYGADLVDAKGNITVKSDAVQPGAGVLQEARRSSCRRMCRPGTTPRNNKWLISGKGALIMNPPSAWAVAKRDAPKVAEQLLDLPGAEGPKGRFAPFLPLLLGHLELLARTSRRPRACSRICRSARRSEKLVAASDGYDMPSFAKLRRLQDLGRGRAAEGHALPLSDPHNHQIAVGRGAPAPPQIAHQIYAQAIQTKMIVQLTQGEPMDKTLAWAESELEGFMRT